MVKIASEGLIDFSFVPSLQCNLDCPFCMYDAGIDKTECLDPDKFKMFISTIDWDVINSIGFYGGEPEININLYSTYLDLLPVKRPKFIISNGSWSTDSHRTMKFIAFLAKYDFHLVVSGTQYHKKFQNQDVLNHLKTFVGDSMTIKGDDSLYPMGRAYKDNWQCSLKCKSYSVATRLALFPNGEILFQNCDGVYPLVQTYEDDFGEILQKVKETKEKCQNRLTIT